MPRIKKTASQPKRKPRTPVKIVRPVYPDFIENFIKEVETKTPFTVKVDQYSEKNMYNVGVNKKEGKSQRCVWYANYAIDSSSLTHFWTSLAMQAVNDKTV